MQTSDLLKMNKEKILVQWEKEVRAKLPSALKENKSALRNSLPEFIEEIGSALIFGIDEIKKEILQTAHKHGMERANFTDYSLEEALEEFNILRRVIFHILEEQEPLPQRERDIIYEAINFGFAKAGTQFSYAQLKKEEAAKDLANQRLQEKILLEERFTLALEASQFGIWEYLHDTQEIFLTKEEARLYELPEGRRIYQIEALLSKIHPDDKNKVLKIVNTESGLPFNTEFRILLSNGDTRWIATHGKGIKDKDSKVFKKIGIDTDITERKVSEQNLEKAAQKMRLITDIQPTLISYLDKKLRYRFVNKTYEDLLKVKKKDIIGKHIQEILGEVSWNHIKPYLSRAMNGEDVLYEKTIPYQTGERYMKVHYRPSFDENHKVEGVYVSVMDLTDQKKTLEALRKSEDEFRTLANALPQLTWMALPDGYIYWFNRRWYQYTGTTPEEAIGWKWEKFHHPEYAAKVQKHFKDKIKEGDVWEDLFPIRKKNGEYRWFLSRAIPIRNKEGVITKWFGTNTDVTDQKKITDELHKEQNLRERFIYTLSHDLRTPLTAARMAAQLIQKRKTSEETVDKQSERIKNNIDRADKMIQDLLDASRLKAGQIINPEINSFKIESIIKPTLENLRTIFGDRFHLESENDFEIYSWSQGVVRVLENLCSNAVKYGSSDRPIDIVIKDQNDHFTLSVHNYGTPIEKGVDVFDEFQRTSSAEKSSKIGWGIGLTIVKGITESIGGEVRFVSHEDGTTFKVMLPKDSRNKIPTHVLNDQHH